MPESVLRFRVVNRSIHVQTASRAMIDQATNKQETHINRKHSIYGHGSLILARALKGAVSDSNLVHFSPGSLTVRRVCECVARKLQPISYRG